MSCCPPAPPIKTNDGVGFVNSGPESEIVPGESVECYAQRAGNTTGKMDDATALVPDKIENTAIPINASNVSVNVTFRLATGSTRTPTTWTLTRNGSPWAVSGVTFTSGGATATLAGTFPTSEYDKPYEVLLTASDGTGQIDARTFKFSPSKATETDSIRFVIPLPGGIVNSKFGPRKHPQTGVLKPHTGIDMKMADRSVVDVVAAADGEVTFAGLNGTLTSGYGNCVKIKHTNGAGKLLCTTVYAHLAKFYVTVGQKVAAGQKIGLEGTTGSSTGNHLHFECRLPNNAPTDPVPYFTAAVSVSDQTTDAGEPAGSQTPGGGGGAAITTAGVEAQTTPCPEPGVDPQTGAIAAPPPDATPDPPALSGSDPFEYAWYFTMTYEVGPHWKTAPQFSPGDAELDAGLYETQLQRKKVGYKPGPNFPGGTTKFGVAQNPNKSTVDVNALTYLKAKSFGKTGYWDLGGSTKCSNKAPLIAIMLFDMNYLHGPGNARAMYSDAGQPGIALPTTSTDTATQIAACEAITAEALKFVTKLNPKYQDGWVNRTNARLAFVKSLTLPLT